MSDEEDESDGALWGKLVMPTCVSMHAIRVYISEQTSWDAWHEMPDTSDAFVMSLLLMHSLDRHISFWLLWDGDPLDCTAAMINRNELFYKSLNSWACHCYSCYCSAKSILWDLSWSGMMNSHKVIIGVRQMLITSCIVRRSSRPSNATWQCALSEIYALLCQCVQNE